MVTLRGLMARVGGDTLFGIGPGLFPEAAARLGLDRKLEVYRASWSRLKKLRAEEEDCRQRDAAEADRRAAEALDRGEPLKAALAGPNAERPHGTAWAARVSGLAPEFGLATIDGTPVSASYIMQALVERIHVLSELLLRDYQRHGEPAGAVNARRELSKAKGRLWEAQRASKEARERFAAIRDAEAEAAVFVAAAAEQAAGAAVDAQQQALLETWAIRV